MGGSLGDDLLRPQVQDEVDDPLIVGPHPLQRSLARAGRREAIVHRAIVGQVGGADDGDGPLRRAHHLPDDLSGAGGVFVGGDHDGEDFGLGEEVLDKRYLHLGRVLARVRLRGTDQQAGAGFDDGRRQFLVHLDLAQGGGPTATGVYGRAGRAPAVHGAEKDKGLGRTLGMDGGKDAGGDSAGVDPAGVGHQAGDDLFGNVGTGSGGQTLLDHSDTTRAVAGVELAGDGRLTDRQFRGHNAPPWFSRWPSGIDLNGHLYHLPGMNVPLVDVVEPAFDPQ